MIPIIGFNAVTIPPKITHQSSVDIFYKPGESVKLKCKASGVPTPTYSWWRADKDINPSGNEDRYVQMQDEGTIIINRPEDKDEGFYQCFAENHYGRAASIKFNMREAKLKSFNIAPALTHTVRLGTSLKLPCSDPDSVPDAQIFWANGSTSIDWNDRVSVDYDNSLHFTYVDTVDDGLCFRCVAENQIVRKSVKGRLHCIQTTGKSPTMAPLKLAWPDYQWDKLGMVGDTISLKCIFSGYPTPKVLWNKKGSGTLNNRIKTGNSGGQELVITDLQLEDAGTYVCSATKLQADRPMEMSIEVTVQSRPEWVIKPEDVTLGEGGDAKFECEGKGVPAVKVNWFINGYTLEDALKKDKRLTQERFHSFRNKLVLENVTLTDTMVVQCNVTNNNGFVYAEAFLNVLEEKPSILEKPENIRVAEGQDFHLACKITGKPDPIITWYKDSVQITGGRYVILESGSLMVMSTVLSDAGNYLCYAQNKHGQVNAEATVKVRRKTIIEVPPMDLEVRTGVNAKFTCSGTTDPQEIEFLTTSWLKDGTGIELGNRMFLNYQDNSLTISGTEQRDTGTYECVISNGLDNDTKSARLVVTDLPLPNTRIKVENNCFQDMQAELSWMPGAFNNAPIQFFTVEYETTTYPNHWVFAARVNYTQDKAFIPLAAGLDYRFRVTSFNKIGPSPPSEPSETRCATRTSPPSQSPQNVRTIGEIPGKLHIEWTPVPPEHQGGDGFRYNLKILKLGDPANTAVSVTFRDWHRYQYILSNAGVYLPYQISIYSANDDGNSTGSSQAIIGYSGEGMPEVYPYNVQVLESGSEYVTLQWEFDRSQIGRPDTKIKGEFKGFKVQIWQKNRRAETIINIDLPPAEFDMTTTVDTFSARVHHMKPNTALEARVAVLNNFYVSQPSEVIGFDSLPGLPGPVSFVQDLNIGDQHINLQWWPALDNRKDVIGYDIGYQEVQGLVLGKLQERIPQIDDPYATTAVLGGLEPNTKYRIFVWARTEAGRSEPYFIERTTEKPGVPLIPRFTIADVGRTSINLTWWKDAYGESGNVVLVEYMKKNGREWISTNPDATRNWARLSLLEPGITYSVRIVVTNGATVRRLSETQDVTTRGTAKAYDISENLGWFLTTLFVVLLQIGLIILFIVCYRRGFRFAPLESPVETYNDKGQTYSDQSALPRTSSAFQDPGGYNNDYYKDADGYEYGGEEYYDKEDRMYDGEHGYNDREGYSDDNYGFDPSKKKAAYYRGNNKEKHDYDGHSPYSDEDDRRYPKENSYEDYDMDPDPNGRRYPHDRSVNTSVGSTDREETRESGYRTENYKMDRPRDVKRDEPRYHGGYSTRSDREAPSSSAIETGRYRNQADRDLVNELRERQSDRNRSPAGSRDIPASRGGDPPDYHGTLI